MIECPRLFKMTTRWQIQHILIIFCDRLIVQLFLLARHPSWRGTRPWMQELAAVFFSASVALVVVLQGWVKSSSLHYLRTVIGT